MGRYRSFTVRPPRPSFTKRAIERWTVQLISNFGDRSERRGEAADWLGVSPRTIDAWCSASDPRVISAELLMELAVGATINQAPIIAADQVYDVVNGYEIITSLRDAGHAAYVADLRGYDVVRRDGKPVRMTEDQLVRSRLRKIIASGHLTLRQISQWVGGDEYAVVDRIMELRNRTHKTLYDFTIDRIDREIKSGYDAGWEWVGAAA
ncbi:hypothetical protein [Allorhizobium undicola]|uniref:hypothetical protein n=1 Tax=Allorhizobium undicola TaxID=78527 RepID=UPI0012B613AD|nr:hypothetical protein [Allorhizobium undicola]